VACSGRGNHIAGVDPIRNNVLVPVSQFPADPNSTTTGNAGILVFHDRTAPAQPAVNSATAGLGSFGTVKCVVDESRRVHVAAQPSAISGPASLTIPTTVWNEVVHCALNTTTNTGSCDDFLLGDPLIGGTVTLSVSQAPAVRGIIAACPGDEENEGHSCGGNGKSDH
jgi:hypothetical protein